MIRRGTTPTFQIEVEDLDITSWDVYVTFQQSKYMFTRKDCAIEVTDYGSLATVELTQAETLGFKGSKDGAPATVQLRAYKDGKAEATSEYEFNVYPILLDGEIPQDVSGGDTGG